MSDPTRPSFRYRLEQQPPHTSCGGLVRGASVEQFPVSQGIAGASMRLQPGCLRELHWHTTAAELGYVVSGSCRTTVLSPDGAATDTFRPGDVWYFPRGWGHSIQGTGPGECHFILMFDNGAFAEDHTLSISDWLAHTSPAVVSQSLGLAMEWTAKLPKGETYFAQGAVPDDFFARATPRTKPTLLTTHRYPLGAQQPRRVPGGGAQWTATADEFPISTTLSVSVLEIEPGAMRELHWHPHADEWQYYLEGAAEMAVYLGMGHAVTEQFVTGDIGYVPMGAGHYIRNTGSGILRLLIGFNNGHYHSHDLSAWIASNPPDVLAANLGLPRTVAEALPKERLFIARSTDGR
jgi:oxalate decarboxylase